jgi:hypothetical protein
VSECDVFRNIVFRAQPKVASLNVLRPIAESGTDAALRAHEGHIIQSWNTEMRKNAMAREQDKAKDEEPVGIVISRGSREEAEPRFVAYVWGPAPSKVDGATRAA